MSQLFIVDARLEDLDILLDHGSADAQVMRVSATEDVHAVLAAVLAERPDAVHLVAHGEPGRVLLGAQPLDAASLLDRSWPDARGTEIHIHACSAGAGAAGHRLIDRLAAATGARVAAATHPLGHPLGHAERGSVWDLDLATGPIHTASPFAGLEAWPHRLAFTGIPTAGNDTLTGDNTPNLIDGGAGDDSLRGGSANDTLIGGADNDTLNGGPGADVLDGGLGFDVATYENATGSVVVDLLNSANNAGEAVGDTFTGIERWVASEFDDTLVGDDSGVWFWGHGGNDVEYGGAGNDTLESGAGNDTVYGGGGDDQIFGRIDDDALYGQAGNDIVGGGAGNDLMDGGAGNDTLIGDWGVDTMQGGDGNDVFMAGEVTSPGYNEAQADLIAGGNGNDLYIVGNGFETGTVSFDGGAGTDTLRVSSDDFADPEGKVSTATPAIDISGMTLNSVEILDLVGSRHHTVTMTAAQANGFASVAGASIGDAFSITGTAMAGTVTAGNGAQLAAGQVQVETVNGVTLMHIGVDGAPGGDVTLRLAGSFEASQFQVGGTGVTLGQVASQPSDPTPPSQPSDPTPPSQPNTPTMLLDRIIDGVTDKATAQAYVGPVSYLQWQYIGDGRGEVVGGSAGNDFLNLQGGNDAAAGGAGDDVLDGGSGSNWLIGGSGNDTFFVDGRNPEPTWSTITDLERGEWTTLWGYREGVSHLTWVEQGGAEGYKGATAHCDIDGNGSIDASVTFAGHSVSEMMTSASSVNGTPYLAFIKL